jgi:hypothetical protein
VFARFALVRSLLLAALLGGVLTCSPSPAQAQVVQDGTVAITGFTLYAWASLSDPRSATYQAMITGAAGVPYQCQHVGRVTATSQVLATQNFYFARSLGDVVGTSYTYVMPPQNEYITLMAGEPSGTVRQTPIRISNAGTQGRTIGSYVAFGASLVSTSGGPNPGVVQAEPHFSYSVVP